MVQQTTKKRPHLWKQANKKTSARLEEERMWSWSSPEEKPYFRHIQIKGDVLILNPDSPDTDDSHTSLHLGEDPVPMDLPTSPQVLWLSQKPQTDAFAMICCGNG